MGRSCAILVLLVTLGCGSTMQNWAFSQGFNLAGALINVVGTVALEALFPNVANTTTTTTTTTGL